MRIERVRRILRSRILEDLKSPALPSGGAPPSCPCAYTDPRFAVASTLTRRLVELRSDVASAMRLAHNEPAAVEALRSLWAEIPGLELRSEGPCATALRDIVAVESDMPIFGPEPIAHLDVESLVERRWQGHHFQAVRTGVSSALAKGVRVGIVAADDVREANALVRPHLFRPSVPVRSDWPCGTPPERMALIAVDDDGPLVVAVALRFGPVAFLEMFMRLTKRPASSPSRYLTHTALVEALHQAGVQHLLVGGAFRLGPGLQHHQHLIGYQPKQVTIRV